MVFLPIMRKSLDFHVSYHAFSHVLAFRPKLRRGQCIVDLTNIGKNLRNFSPNIYFSDACL